jgi:predicted ribosomally synthesized peptide with nif11-like leader
MSTATEFVKKLYQDESMRDALSEKLGVTSVEFIRPADQESGEKIISVAKEWGYEFNLTEIQEAYKALLVEHSGELSEAELEMVAGGTDVSVEVGDRNHLC